MKRKWISGLLILFAGAACWCGWRYYQEQILPEKELDEALDTQLQLYEQVRPTETAASETAPPVSEISAPETTQPETDFLAEARAVNSEVAGWITIPGTHIDYPVAQAEDNEFYLHHGFDRAWNNKLGSPFLDCRCERGFTGFNSIVYAHHMTRQRMFADIALYQDPAFMQSHPAGTLTLRDGVHPVSFFAYMTASSTAPVYQTVFLTDAERFEYLDSIFQEANYTQRFSAEELKRTDDLHLLLLSTCTFEFSEARGVLIGVFA